MSQLLHFWLNSLLNALGRQRRMAHVFGPLHPHGLRPKGSSWLPTSEQHSDQMATIGGAGVGEPVDRSSHSLSLYLSVILLSKTIN